MISREDFQTLAKKHRIVPVWRHLVADMVTPVSAFCRIVGEEPGFLLESVEDSERWSRFSFIGRRPLANFVAHGRKVEVKCFIESEQPRVEGDTIEEEIFSELPLDDGILKTLEAFFLGYSSPKSPISSELPFWGGVAGYLGYDIMREIEHIPNVPPDERGLPDAIMEVIGQLVVFDHWKQQVTLVDNILLPQGASKAQIDSAYDLGMDKLAELGKDGTIAQPEPLFEPPNLADDLPEMEANLKPQDYEAMVEAGKEHILEGDILQVVLSECFALDLDAEPLDVYRVLRQINPSPYMFFLRYRNQDEQTPAQDLTILGSSPETLVQVREGKVVSRPIAGTRPRGGTQIEDKNLAAELVEHPKEKAEHIMLVDLARNDLGRVVEFGSLEVEELMVLERYSHVMHMTSQVSGNLSRDLNLVDVLRATFPAGTVSGAPKIRAMEIIDELEPAKRGPYAGMVGYLDFSNSLDSAIAIRTMIIKGNRAWVQAGAGIVADSVPVEEEQECRNKAGALLAAIPGARKMSQARKNSKLKEAKE